METTEKVVLIEPNEENIHFMFKLISQFAADKEYDIKGELKLPTNLLGITKGPKFDSRSKMKVVRTYLTRLNKKITMGQTNRFLHFLFKKIYKTEGQAPSLVYTTKEQEIRNARKAYKEAMRNTEELQKKYKETKGDFYKKRLTK